MEAQPPPITPGVKTTEFWIVVIMVIAGSVSEFSGSDQHWIAVAAAISAIIYKVGRVVLKLRGSAALLPEIEMLRGELAEAYQRNDHLLDRLRDSVVDPPEGDPGAMIALVGSDADKDSQLTEFIKTA